LASPVSPRIPTGFPALDALLGGGWPTGMLTELLVSRHGTGELGLLSPALARLTRDTSGDTSRDAPARWVMLIGPPWIPYAPGLCWQGLVLDRVLMVRVRRPPEVLWAMDETLRSGACAGVIAWAGTAAVQRPGHALLQRLHLLAGRHQAWAVLIRTARFRRQRSPARLRLEILSASPDTLQVEIFRNGWRGAGAVTVERRF
jgi:hypothetical protein